MSRLFSLAFIIAALAVPGCSSSDSTNILEDADQAAIDAYDAQAAENEKALNGYEGVEK
ncbi:hypothetical protein [Novipirellula rosea]|mgnify:CR=1 FL=1|uniref:Secreted protein n=1 Tax=Novipirellula rosea TaxID=1031540 RepID=A0ABP8MS06_9BACT|tara:strand:+ start:1066 stop:1242 length:177 start_codon:yes stop_codon:yes gene_type:complete